MIPGMALTLRGGGSVIPIANWSDIDGTGVGYGGTASFVTGIDEPIILRAEISGVTSVRGASGSMFESGGGDSCPIVDGAAMEFTVNPNDYLTFSVNGSGSANWYYSATATIKYRPAGSSSFSQTLDAFAITNTEYIA